VGGPSITLSSAVCIEDIMLASSPEALSSAVHIEDLMLGTSPPLLRLQQALADSVDL
jgi:hypothetical protein